ncbi:hypothetical protein BC831DRAFT_504019 [Entophlyctis helioformis]|nr:hypothetical protein BC831DRAFT_504019 [Entophlyctis helioformis]
MSSLSDTMPTDVTAAGSGSAVITPAVQELAAATPDDIAEFVPAVVSMLTVLSSNADNWTDEAIDVLLGVKLGMMGLPMPTGAHLAAVRARIRSRDTAAPAIRNISESVVQGLNRPLVDAHQCVESFNNYIDDISETWAIRGMQHVAPYGAMVQSSGMGKTRTCIEVAKQRFAIYTNLRDQKSTGYPLRSLIADRFKVIPISQFTHWSIGFLLGCINHLAASIESNPALTPSAWIALQVGRKVDVDQFWNDALVHIDSALAMIESDGFPKDAPASGSGTGRKKKAEGYLERAMANLQAKIEHLQQQQQEQEQQSSTAEAETQTWSGPTSFDYFRDVLSCLPRSDAHPVTAIFTDTNIKIANFLPSAPPSSVSSLRQADALTLFSPFWRISYWDLVASEQQPVHRLIQAQFDSARLYPRRPIDHDTLLCSIWATHKFKGRPIWMDAGNDLRCEAQVDLARCKIVGVSSSANLELTKAETNKQPLFAMATAVLCLKTTGAHKLVMNMTTSHMAVCYLISESRDAMVVGYPSDPILAEGVMTLLREDTTSSAAEKGVVKTSIWKLLMSSLIAAVEEGAVVDAGLRGELVKSATYRSRTMPITVGEFLNGLFGTNALGRAATQYLQSMGRTHRTRASRSAGATMGPIDPEFLDGIVAFNHYMFVRNGQSNGTLPGAFDRFAAILCKVNQKAVDIVIPVYLPSRKCFSAILVQVKNQSAKVSAQEAQEITDAAADFSFGETPYLVLFLSIHRDDPSLMFIAETRNMPIGRFSWLMDWLDSTTMRDHSWTSRSLPTWFAFASRPHEDPPQGQGQLGLLRPCQPVQSGPVSIWGLGSGAMSGPSGGLWLEQARQAQVRAKKASRLAQAPILPRRLVRLERQRDSLLPQLVEQSVAVVDGPFVADVQCQTLALLHCIPST